MIQICCPCAGAGQRIVQKYGGIKPLLNVLNRPMYSWVIENLRANDAKFIFVTQNEHCQKYGLDELLEKECKKFDMEAQIVRLNGLTDGCVRSILSAESLINNSDKLLIADIDQMVNKFDTESFFKQMEIDNVDGGITVFEHNNPKWSYSRVNKTGYVCHVVEKQPISNLANAGLYGWMKGSDFVNCANDMIKEDFRVNGELYNAPTYDFAVRRGLIIKAYYYRQRAGLGSVDDVEKFPEIYKTWTSL